MRFAFLNQFYPPDPAPTGQFLQDLCRELARRGHEVRVVCSSGAYASVPRLAPGTEAAGIEVRRIPGIGFDRASVARRVASYCWFLAAAAFHSARMRPRPDLLVALTTPPYVGLAAAVVGRALGIRHAHWIMDVYPDALAARWPALEGTRRWRLLRGAMRNQLRDAAAVLTLGPHMQSRIEAYTSAASPREWVPLWGLVDSAGDAGREMRARRGWAEDRLVLMYAGNLGAGHRFEEFLEAARRLGPDGPTWVFVGDSGRREQIQAAIARGNGARIDLLPYVSREHLGSSLLSADVHLISLASRWQGIIAPSKLQAAFSLRRPVIFVGPGDNEVASWVAESGGGWLVREGDVEGLIQAIQEAGDPDERARRAGCAEAFARKLFDGQKNCGRIADVLEAAGRRGLG